jgi:hypothetical protein
VAVAAGWAVLGAQAARRPDRRHRLTAAPVAWGLAGVALAIQAVTVAVNLDAPRWEQAGAVGLWIVPVVLAAGAGPAWLAHRLERGRPVAAGAGGRPPQRASVGLAPGERAVWTAHTSSPYGGAAAAAAAVLLPAAGFVAGGAQGWILVGAGLVLAVAIGTVSELTATVDARGLTLAHGPFARPRWTVPLAEVAAAEPADIDPWRVGGWGVRKVPGRRGATAVVVRGGPGLRVCARTAASCSSRSRTPRPPPACSPTWPAAPRLSPARRAGRPRSPGPRGRSGEGGVGGRAGVPRPRGARRDLERDVHAPARPAVVELDELAHGEGGPQALAQLGHELLRDALHRHLADGVGGGDPPLALPPLLHRELVRRHPRRG